jgi:hypothetical protein
MRFTQLTDAIRRQFEVTNQVIFFIEGAPGGGKSAAAAVVGQQLGFERVVQFFPAHREPVDFLGTPAPSDEVTVWRPPQELLQLQTGRNLLIVEELTDSSVPVQNVMCGMFHDRKIGAVTLSPDTYIIATGNRAKDKSGATRLISKLSGRVRRLTFTEDLQDWEDWAVNNSIDPVLIAYLRFSGNLAAFDPAMDSSPTPRNWSRVSLIPTDMPQDVYFESVQGDVGAGAAAGYIAFRNIYRDLPDLRGCLADPLGVSVPDRLDVAYATLGALARADKGVPLYIKNQAAYDAALTYARRFSADLTVMFVQDANRIFPAGKSSRAFIDFAIANQDVLF